MLGLENRMDGESLTEGGGVQIVGDDITTGWIMVYGSQWPQGGGFEDIKVYRREERRTIYHKAFKFGLID